MSTKIWEAYRLKKNVDVWEFACEIREKAQARVRTKLRGWIDAIVADCANHPKFKARVIRAMNPDATDEKIASEEVGPWSAAHWIFTEYRKQAGGMERNPFDCDVSIVFRKHRGRWHVVPYPGSGMLGDCLRFLRRDKRLEDYHYQNSTDKSAKCSDRAWEQRGRDWDAMIDDGAFDNKLTLDIVSVHGFTRVDPSLDMARKAARKKKVGRKP